MKSKNDFYKDFQAASPFTVLKKALENGRLPHAILLHGNNIEELEAISFEIAKQLLTCNRQDIQQHPDFFSIRPTNKMRQINAQSTRELIQQIQHTPSQANRKVAAIYEADRMNLTAANAFLKTLEEPPQNTTIFLLTSKPYALLETIRSRCLNFGLPQKLDKVIDEQWEEWKTNYNNWMEIVQKRPDSKKHIEKVIISVYKMIVDFEQILARLGNQQWEKNKKTLSQDLSEEEEIAQKTGVVKAIRQHLFKEIQQTTHDLGIKNPSLFEIKKLIQIIAELERIAKLIEINLNECTALEAFLLSSLRIWSA